jgi:hypothetical protein
MALGRQFVPQWRSTTIRLFLFAAIALNVLISTSQRRLRAGELDIGIVDPIGRVGHIGKVGPIDQVVDSKKPTDGVRSPADTGYLVCWNWNLAKETKWRCTQQLADLPKAREFSNYQNGRYELGQSFFLPVYQKDWDDRSSHQRVMERVQKEAIPKAMQRVAGREDEPSRNPERAALIRKQIQFVQPEWVDVKPELPKGVKASDARESKKVGYDDEFVISTQGGTSKDKMEAIFTGHNWRSDERRIDYGDRVVIDINVYSFAPDHSATNYHAGMYNSSGPQITAEKVFEEAMNSKFRHKGTWTVRDDGTVELTLRVVDTDYKINLSVQNGSIIEKYDGSSKSRKYNKIDK